MQVLVSITLVLLKTSQTVIKQLKNNKLFSSFFFNSIFVSSASPSIKSFVIPFSIILSLSLSLSDWHQYWYCVDYSYQLNTDNKKLQP